MHDKHLKIESSKTGARIVSFSLLFIVDICIHIYICICHAPASAAKATLTGQRLADIAAAAGRGRNAMEAPPVRVWGSGSGPCA